MLPFKKFSVNCPPVPTFDETFLQRRSPIGSHKPFAAAAHFSKALKELRKRRFVNVLFVVTHIPNVL